MHGDPKEMTDAELRAAFAEAQDDLAVAARDEPESEWHQACFAGVMVYAAELAERGLSVSTLH